MALASVLFAVVAAAAVPQPTLLTYGGVGRELLTDPPPGTSKTAGGFLERNSRCLVLRSHDGETIPLWPPGTTIAGSRIRLPNGRTLIVGKQVNLLGRYVFTRDGSLQRSAANAQTTGACGSRAFLVQKAERAYVPRDVRDYAEMSDAVLVVRLVGMDTQAPLGDGLLSTFYVRVEEVLHGRGYPVGSRLRLRNPAGINASGQWQTGTHHPLFHAFGHSKVARGDRLLVFLNRDFYRQQAEARGGNPLKGYSGGGSVFRIEEDRIVNETNLTVPATVSELRAQLRRR